MSNTDNASQILIRRYSKLKNASLKKTRTKFENMTIDEVIVKHEKAIVFTIVLFVIMLICLIIQFVSLYHTKSIQLALITNVLMLMIFQKGLHDNLEIKEVLKTLKEIGLH